MKNRIILFSAVIATIASAIVSCDYVDMPYEPKAPESEFDSLLTVKDTVIGDSLRNVLIEDFTGHTCGNCPKQARALKTFLSTYTYKEKVIICAVHSGGFAVPKPTDGYPADFRTPEGETYFSTGSSPFGIETNPAFLVSRSRRGKATYKTSVPGTSAFKLKLDSLAANYSSDFILDMVNAYDTVHRTVKLNITLKALKNLSSNYKVVVFLMEDGIIAPQSDYVADPNHVEEFEHEHLFRGTLNGTWGQDVFGGKAPSMDENYSFEIKGFKVKEMLNNFPIDPKHCYLVAYVYDANSAGANYYEILQVQKLGLYPHE